ncbi:hypothetical protein O6H91_05G084900 [Diphasiastrum complanatum]|uniref:Uncharacterized protein n=1 Tax=Diphasiastrum complanatum TaxID=34168 RepID=A0ACC2DQC9_DIPCM|nr:hypothetical protein O6H91_05G084900 [Diphasiastrum complanatum]
MAILYALVARGTVVLAEFSAASGNASTIARRILEKLPPGGDNRVSYSQDRHIFHIMKADGLTFLCMAADTFGRRIPFAFLEDVHLRFLKTYGRVAQTALAYAMNDEFSRVLHQQMEYFSSNPNADTINRMKGEINEGFTHLSHSAAALHRCSNILWGTNFVILPTLKEMKCFWEMPGHLLPQL